MKTISALLLAFATAVAGLSAAEAGFWQRLTPEERKAAGVDQLTPD